MGENLGDHGGSSIAATIFKRPPHWGQCSRSISNTRLSNRAQLMGAGAAVSGGGKRRGSGGADLTDGAQRGSVQEFQPHRGRHREDSAARRQAGRVLRPRAGEGTAPPVVDADLVIQDVYSGALSVRGADGAVIVGPARSASSC